MIVEDPALAELRKVSSLLRALLTITVASGLVGVSTTDKVWLLSSSGLKVTEIAQILGINSHSVSQMLHERRKKGMSRVKESIKSKRHNRETD